jgi:hypothetical protein
MIRMTRGRLGAWVALCLTVASAGCTTEVELNAPYEERSLAFCLLDPAATDQWVRVNRTWLGEGNNLDIAMIADSSEYASGEIDITVEQFHPDDVVFETPLLTFTAMDSLLQDKDDNGIFYGPEYRAYHFDTPDGLDVYVGSSDDLYIYRMTVGFADQRAPLTAVTTLIGGSPGNISNPPAGIPGFNLNFASGAVGQVTYPNINFKWSSTPGAKRYEASIAVYFTERIWADAAHTNLVSETDRVVRWDLGEETADDAEGGEEIKLPTNGEAFYQFLASRLEADPLITRELGEWNNNIDRVRAFDFVLSIANQELDTYLAVNAPVTGIIQERPVYTNIAGGLGLLASRTQQSVNGLGISKPSVQELVEGEHTAALQFCLPPETEGDVSEYACP